MPFSWSAFIGPAPIRSERSEQVMRLLWIGLRPGRDQPVIEPQSADLRVGAGIVGDRFKPSKGSKREVTLLLTPQIETISAAIGHVIPYAMLRRNLVIETDVDQLCSAQRYRLGDALIEITGTCPPCGRMREKIGDPGFRAMRGRGGFTARVIRAGRIRIDDPLILLGNDTSD